MDKVEELVKQYKEAKDEIKRNDIFIKIKSKVIKLIFSMLKTYTDKDDYLQEIDLALLQCIQKFKPNESSFVTYLYYYIQKGIAKENKFRKKNGKEFVYEANQPTYEPHKELETEDLIKKKFNILQQDIIRLKMEGYKKIEIIKYLGITAYELKKQELKIQKSWKKES